MKPAEIAVELGITTHRVVTALKLVGLRTPRPGWSNGSPPAAVDRDRIVQLYAEGKNLRETADRVGTTVPRIRRVLVAAGVSIRPAERAPVLLPDIPRETLVDLYVDQRLDDVAIGEQFAVPAWRIRQLRQELDVTRPTGGPPRPQRRRPSTRQLRELYTGKHLTLVEIARFFGTSSPQVRRWLEEVGIEVAPRTSRATRVVLDGEQIRHLYWERQWSANAIADQFDTTVQLVLRQLHQSGVPVRTSGPATQIDHATHLMAELYGDSDVLALLTRHGIPVRAEPGPLVVRFPAPYPLQPVLLREAYEQIGLAAAQIEILTGQPAAQILDALHLHEIEVRLSGPSPWYRRHRLNLRARASTTS